MASAPAQPHQPDSQQVLLPDSDTVPVAERELIVGNILISGNRRTRDFIVMREVPFRKGTRILEAELPG
ncbi:MAG TPA: hypothetical protein VG842_07915, partial [Sediminibacterium sp.]|nr:hypothetical protein [Sediminibacterium sp.]